MKSNQQIREEAWKLVRGKWFWRLFTAGGALYLIMMTVMAILTTSYEDMNIQTWSEFMIAKMQAAQEGLGYTVPSMTVFWQMTGATAFQYFISYIFGGILVFGLVGLMLNAVRDDENAWFSRAFGGFKRPLELAWLMLVINLLVMIWTIFLVIPGLIALYRYRQAWYLKSENPGWSAMKCLSESGRMMRGFKWRAFCLDFSFIGWFLILGVIVAVSMVIGMVETKSPVVSVVASLIGLVSFYVMAFIGCYFLAARTVFFKELSCARA